jgi:hypothetical protein
LIFLLSSFFFLFSLLLSCPWVEPSSHPLFSRFLPPSFPFHHSPLFHFSVRVFPGMPRMVYPPGLSLSLSLVVSLSRARALSLSLSLTLALSLSRSFSRARSVHACSQCAFHTVRAMLSITETEYPPPPSRTRTLRAQVVGILDSDSKMFVVKMWRMLLFEVLKAEVPVAS